MMTLFKVTWPKPRSPAAASLQKPGRPSEKGFSRCLRLDLPGLFPRPGSRLLSGSLDLGCNPLLFHIFQVPS